MHVPPPFSPIPRACAVKSTVSPCGPVTEYLQSRSPQTARKVQFHVRGKLRCLGISLTQSVSVSVKGTKILMLCEVFRV